MAELILVVSEKTGIEKMFRPIELSTFPGSVAHKATPAIDPREAAQDHVAKFRNCGIYGTWITYAIDTQSETRIGETNYHGFEMWEVNKSSFASKDR